MVIKHIPFESLIPCTQKSRETADGQQLHFVLRILNYQHLNANGPETFWLSSLNANEYSILRCIEIRLRSIQCQVVRLNQLD